jgi:heavy metal sensor kinase
VNSSARSGRFRQRARKLSRFVRSLRFRLAASYLVFFTLLLIGLGLVFRTMLVTILENQVARLLEEEWAVSQGYLRFENRRPLWFFDRLDPLESLVVNRIRRIIAITDADGRILERSDAYRDLGTDSLQNIHAVIRSGDHVILTRYDDEGVPHMIIQGSVKDGDGEVYFVAIGRSLAEGMRTVNNFMLGYFALMPGFIALCAVLGWILAGRALRPVTSLAQTAHAVTGSTLDMRIPLRDTGDELDELIEAFNRMIGRLHQSFEQIRQFSTDVSHELRTPLTAIRGQLEVALFTAKTPEQYQDAMVNALQDVEQLSNIVKALLQLSQAESGQLALQMAPVDLSELAHNMAEQYQISAEVEGVRLTTDLTPGCVVRADRTQMERLISNLLSNAVKYTRGGGAVVLCVKQKEGAVHLIVEDTGIGIPAEKLPHIFDRFYRVRSARKSPVEGLGLGLSFVSWIVEAHGAKIEVESSEGKGTRFTVRFPAAV